LLIITLRLLNLFQMQLQRIFKKMMKNLLKLLFILQ